MPQSVVVAASMKDYFHEAIRSALEYQALQPDEATTTYLVDLLCRFTRAVPDLSKPLAPVLARARLSDSVEVGQSIRRLKQVGDRSLYVAGYFSDSLRRQQLDTAYYTHIGGAAYRRLSRFLRRRGRSTRLVVVFSELGTGFARFVDLLGLVKEHGDPDPTGEELGRLYAIWLETADEAIARRLRRAGVVLLEPPRTKQ